jgi:fructose-specific phosphotransferase system IIC component
LGVAGLAGAFVTGLAGSTVFATTLAERFFVTGFLAGFLAPVLFAVAFLPARFAAVRFATFLTVFLTTFFEDFLLVFWAALRPFFLEDTVPRRDAALPAFLAAFFFFFAAVFLALAITLP